MLFAIACNFWASQQINLDRTRRRRGQVVQDSLYCCTVTAIWKRRFGTNTHPLTFSTRNDGGVRCRRNGWRWGSIRFPKNKFSISFALDPPQLLARVCHKSMFPLLNSRRSFSLSSATNQRIHTFDCSLKIKQTYFRDCWKNMNQRADGSASSMSKASIKRISPELK